MDNLDGGEDENVAVRFVIPEGETELTVSGCMMTAFQMCQDQMPEAEGEWVRAEEVINLSPTKTDVFVLDSFEGPVFDHLSKGDRNRCTVIGPRCLTTCLQSNIPVPNLPYPMYSISMRGLSVTCTGLTKEEKTETKTLVERMAGVYSPDFHDGVTHLVSGNVTSAKYKVAVETGISVMTKEWVKEVWKSCQRDNVNAVDPRFLKYKCPVFCGLTVTVSQLSRTDKNLLKKKIESHGGTYMAELTLEKTDILICMNADGDKYSYSMKWKIPCLKPDWVFHSVDKGYALPMDDYKVSRKSNKASTPTKSDITVTGLEDVSMCSTILNPDDSAVTSRVDDTVNSSVMGVLSVEQQSKTTEDWLSELDLAKVKKAGHFLDNLKIYLSGFSEKDQVLMTRVLKYAGATRLTQLVDSVTHVVHAVNRNVESETTRILKDLGICPYMVSLEWTVESMKRGQKVPEKDYAFPPTDQGKGDKTFRSPQQSAAVPAVEAAVLEGNILDQYKQNTNPGPEPEETTMTNDNSSQIDPFFANLKFELVGLGEESEQDLSEWINEVGGDVVFSDFKGVVDYLITPVKGGKSKLKYKHHLNNLWVEESLDSGKMLDPQYYHYPAPREVLDAPLSGCVTCVSGYTNRERMYVNAVVDILGGNPQEMFAKKDNSAKNVSASTHLLCPEGEGQKYNAAVKWGLPVISKDWLVACLKEMKWISEKPFLVGTATAFTKNKPLPAPDSPDKTLEDDQDIEDNDSTVLQDIDQNQASKRSSMGSKDPLSTLQDKSSRRRSSRGLSPEKALKQKSQGTKNTEDLSTVSTPVSKTKVPTDTPITAKKMEIDMKVDTPVTSRKMDVDPDKGSDTPFIAKLNINTPSGLTPGLAGLRSRPSDVYSPLPSQPWPDTQQQTPVTSGVKRKREGGLEDMPTPKTPYGEHMGRNPSPTTRKFYKKRMEGQARMAEMFRANTEQLEQDKKWQDIWLNSKPGDSAYEREQRENKAKLGNFFNERYEHIELEKDGRSLDDRMREQFNKAGKNWDTIEEDVGNKHRKLNREQEEEEMEVQEENVLSGVKVYVAKKLDQLNRELDQIVVQLGGSVTKDFNQPFTHFVFQGKSRDLTKEFRLAKDAGKIIVSPDWIYMCRSESRRVEESAFPHTYNPKTTISLSETQNSAVRGRPKSRQTKLPQPVFREDEDEPEKEVEAEANDDKAEEEEDEVEMEKGDETATTQIIDDPVIPASANKTNKSFKKDLKAFESLVDSLKNTPTISLSSASKHKPMQLDMSEDVSTISTPQPKKEEEVKESQVLWIDPEEEKHREELAIKLSMDSQDLGSINFSENMTCAMETENKVFLLTGGVDEKEMEDACRSLGGEMRKSQEYDDSCTHLVTVKVNRSERMLGCIASGRWILHPSYVSDSLKAGLWLQEDKYEWGNPEVRFIDLASGEVDAKISIAGRRRRLARERGENSIFSGMYAHLAMPDKRVGPFKRLILAGGGKVAEKLNDDIIPSLTHVLTESKFFSSLKGKIGSLAEFSIPVIKPIYLNECLTSSEKRPVVESYIVDEYRGQWETKKRSRITTDTPTSVGKKSRV